MTGNATFGSSNDGTVLGNFFKLQTPSITEVTPDNFQDWSYKMKNYVSTLDFRLGKILSSLETQTSPVTHEQVISFFDDGLDTAQLSAAKETKHLNTSAQLNYFLCNMVSGRTALLLRSNSDPTATPNGFESWRLIAEKNYREKNATAHSLMSKMLNHRFTTNTFTADLEQFELLKKQYETSLGKPCDDSLLVGLMFTKTQTVLPKVNEHLKLHSANFTTYAQVRQLITDYLKIGDTNGPGTVTDGTVNALWNGKGKGKDWRNNNWRPNYYGGNYNYSKGNGEGKAKPKSESKGNYSYFKGKGKSKGKGKGYSNFNSNYKGKSKGNGKGKDYSTATPMEIGKKGKEKKERGG